MKSPLASGGTTARCRLRGGYAHATQEEYVFPSRQVTTRDGVPSPRSGAWSSRSPAGIPGASTHWLRHAHATHSMDAGASLCLIMAIMGRADPLTPARYQYVRPTPRPRITCRFNSALANEKRHQQLTFREGGASRCSLLHWEPG